MVVERYGLAIALSLSLSSLAHAEGGRGDPVDWLVRMATSAQQLNYGGVFTFSHDGRAETSRVVHFNDGGSELGKVETLDGPPREIIRENNQLSCYMPDVHVVKLDRVEGRRFFPALLSGSPAQLRDFYNISFAGMDRVAGRDCRMIRLEPRDAMRFGFRLCADLDSGLMLRATLEDGARGVLQQFAFSNLEVEPGVDRTRVRPTWSGAGWIWDRTGLEPGGVVAWTVNNPPPGFRKVIELRRAADNHGGQIVQMVYSDGISAMSLFIEAPHGSPEATTLSRGALSFYTLRSGDRQLTSIGEVPPAAVAQLVRSAAPVANHPE